MSIGIAIYPDNAQSVDRLLANADAAMHHAKSLGKNQYHFFSPETNASVQNHFGLEKNLRRAIDNNELEVFYQPKIDIVSGETVGFESLLRWHSEEYGAVSPTVFIPIAEKSGLITEIGEWVIDTACQQARKWLDSHYPICISVNLSGRQFHHIGNQKNRLFDVIAGALERYELPPELLELEITENIMVQHLAETLNTLERLKSLGVKIAIDDFGTGYSSLSYIKKFPIDSLKIDKSFIKDLATDANDAAIVNAIVEMAKQLNIEVVVEGIETEEQLSFFKNNKERIVVQGYYFCRALPAEQITYIYG
jgi:EAL domain-containing protein (putative c-di-GMP-specific phosphodiesterase class I)